MKNSVYADLGVVYFLSCQIHGHACFSRSWSTGLNSVTSCLQFVLSRCELDNDDTRELQYNDLLTLPANIFDDLTSLKTL